MQAPKKEFSTTAQMFKARYPEINLDFDKVKEMPQHADKVKKITAEFQEMARVIKIEKRNFNENNPKPKKTEKRKEKPKKKEESLSEIKGSFKTLVQLDPDDKFNAALVLMDAHDAVISEFKLENDQKTKSLKMLHDDLALCSKRLKKVIDKQEYLKQRMDEIAYTFLQKRIVIDDATCLVDSD